MAKDKKDLPPLFQRLVITPSKDNPFGPKTVFATLKRRADAVVAARAEEEAEVSP